MTTITQSVDLIVFIIIILAVILYVVKKGQKGIYSAALYLVSVAEEEWGSQTGKIKFAEVMAAIKAQFPIISLFLREETIEKIIESALEEMKLILENKQAKELEDFKKLLESEDTQVTPLQ